MVEDMDLMQEPIELDIEPSATLGTILIIEDDPRMQKVLRRIFIEEHYAVVIVAGDGQTGLDLFRSEHPIAVVLDLILPRVSGRELLPDLQDPLQRYAHHRAERDQRSCR